MKKIEYNAKVIDGNYLVKITKQTDHGKNFIDKPLFESYFECSNGYYLASGRKICGYENNFPTIFFMPDNKLTIEKCDYHFRLSTKYLFECFEQCVNEYKIKFKE